MSSAIPSSSRPCRALLLVRRAPTRLRHVFLFDPIDVELCRARDDLVERLVEVERRRLRKARVVHTRNHERLQIRARQSFGLEFLDRRAYGVVELQDFPGPAIAFLDRFAERLVEKGVDAPQNRLVRSATQARPLLVTGPEREERGLLELER